MDHALLALKYSSTQTILSTFYLFMNLFFFSYFHFLHFAFSAISSLKTFLSLFRVKYVFVFMNNQILVLFLILFYFYFCITYLFPFTLIKCSIKVP